MNEIDLCLSFNAEPFSTARETRADTQASRPPRSPRAPPGSGRAPGRSRPRTGCHTSLGAAVWGTDPSFVFPQQPGLCPRGETRFGGNNEKSLGPSLSPCVEAQPGPPVAPGSALKGFGRRTWTGLCGPASTSVGCVRGSCVRARDHTERRTRPSSACGPHQSRTT